MLAAYRLSGFWRIDIETGHFFASEDVHAIFDLPYSDGPLNLTELMSRTHEDDRSLIAQTLEEASLGVSFHSYTASTIGLAVTSWCAASVASGTVKAAATSSASPVSSSTGCAPSA